MARRSDVVHCHGEQHRRWCTQSGGPSGDGTGLSLGYSTDGHKRELESIAPYANEPSFAETIGASQSFPRTTWERGDAPLLLPHQKRSGDNPPGTLQFEVLLPKDDDTKVC